MGKTSIFYYPKHFDFALVLRGVAALLVVFWHAGGCDMTSRLSSYLVSPGRTAVWVFFSLSGYLLTSGFHHGKYDFRFNRLKDFYQNRFIRVYPIFLLVSLVSLAGHVFWIKQPLALDLSFVLRNFFMLQWSHSYPLNGAFWTLGIEMQFYFFFPLIVWFQIKRKSARTSFLIYLFFIVILFPLKHLDSTLLSDARNLLGNLMHFQLGVFLCFAQDTLQEKTKNLVGFKRNALISLPFILYIISNRFYRTNNDAFFGWKGILLVDMMTFFFLILHLMWEGKKLVMTAWTKFLTILGILSYGVYAWHPLVQVFDLEREKVLWYVIFVSYVLAFVSYLSVEKNILKWKK